MASSSTVMKETPDLLMSIIRTIANSDDVAKREQEKTKLEKAYKESDRKLDKLVQENYADLTSIIQAFSKISTRLSGSQERIRSIKDNLQSCKNLLHCKRDELRKLWIEGIEQKTVVGMLDKIEEVKNVPDKLQGCINRKQYLLAAEMLVNSISLLEGDLSRVEALKDVKSELLSKKEELYDMLVDELHRQIYIKSTSSVVKGFQRQGSLRGSNRGEKVSYHKLALKKSAEHAEIGFGSFEEDRLEQLQAVNLDDIIAPQHIPKDIVVDPELEYVQFISILIESLAVLKKLPEAIDGLRSRIRPGLLMIVQRSSQQVADNAYLEGEDISQLQQPQFLLELLELVFKQFRIVARVHAIVLANMKRIKNSMSSLGDFCLYDTTEIWLKIQNVLQLFLGDYLDIRNTAGSQSQGSSGFDEPTSDVGSYFAKKKPNKPKKFALFRFEASSHAISMSSYLREQRQEFYGSGEILNENGDGMDVGKTQFVCKPGASNITLIYNPLQKFMREIEDATHAQSGTLTLQGFIKEFIKNVYLDQVHFNIQSTIEYATRGTEAQRTTIDLRTQKELQVPKPLLHSTVTVARNIIELCNLMRDLPDYADQFLTMICKILQAYRETCYECYKNVVMNESEEKRIISATWAKDEDISRFLRSLPNWRNLKEEQTEGSEMSEEDLRAMNSKESSILTSNLSTTEAVIPEQEIITDVGSQKALGNMCESLEWFSSKINDLSKTLGDGNQQFSLSPPENKDCYPSIPAVSENTLMTLQSLSKDFSALSEVCLLVLHLEVRVHCFYYLKPISKQSNYCGAIDDMDPDSSVIKLNKKISAFEEVMQQSVQPRKFKYIFEGLGHLVSSILVNSTQFLRRVNENGIKKMCRNIFAIQQCLTNITMNRESDLDHARQYYELLYLNQDELLKVVVERGPQFTEQEYINLLSLKNRSERSFKEEDLPKVLMKLSDILNEYDSSVI